MSAALRWLGGSEEEMLLNKLASALVGQWADREGSIYTLMQGGTDEQHTIDVVTVRPTGERRFTKALVQCHTSGTGDAVMFWGRWPPSRFDGLVVGEGRITWRRGSCTFDWQKLQ